MSSAVLLVAIVIVSVSVNVSQVLDAGWASSNFTSYKSYIEV